MRVNAEDKKPEMSTQHIMIVEVGFVVSFLNHGIQRRPDRVGMNLTLILCQDAGFP